MRNLLFFLFFFPLFAAEMIDGFWKTVDEEGTAQSIIAIYPYQDLHYGRIIATFSSEGVIDDSIYHPIKRAPGLPDHPYYSGLDIIWDLRDHGSKFKGKILDPQKGDVYKSELWREGPNLVVRGKYLIFGRSQTWYPVQESDWPTSFVKPDLSTFVPKVPIDG